MPLRARYTRLAKFTATTLEKKKAWGEVQKTLYTSPQYAGPVSASATKTFPHTRSATASVGNNAVVSRTIPFDKTSTFIVKNRSVLSRVWAWITGQRDAIVLAFTSNFAQKKKKAYNMRRRR